VTKAPKFFCESCGSEVRQNAKFCLHCGKFFASVKCPSCGFIGDSRLFRDGCPACGYAVYAKDSPSTRKTGAKKKEEADPLPWWIYLLAVLLLGVVTLLILLRR
jgi:predicted RNA-binding Zn-ribbon protein involved in translation (DUF1610 family)